MKHSTHWAAVTLSILVGSSAASADPRSTSTFTEDFDSTPPGDSLTVNNMSTGGETILAVRFDLTNTAGDVVFDSNVEGGHPPTFDSISGDVGYYDHEFSNESTNNGRIVYKELRVDFSGFDPGEGIRINHDSDADGGSDAYVEGSEFAGAEFTVTFSNGEFSGVFSETGDTEAKGFAPPSVPSLGKGPLAMVATLLIASAAAAVGRTKKKRPSV